MDEGKQRELIEAAKIALRTTGEWTSVMRDTFLWVQRNYVYWKFGHKGPTIDELHEQERQVEKITKKYLRDIKLLGWESDAMSALAKELQITQKHLEIISELEEYDEQVVPRSKKRGAPMNLKLRTYTYQMAAWYTEFIGDDPRYGTFSTFTKFVGNCLSILDEHYLENPPYKTIQNTLIELRKLFPHGLSLTTLYS